MPDLLYYEIKLTYLILSYYDHYLNLTENQLTKQYLQI